MNIKLGRIARHETTLGLAAVATVLGFVYEHALVTGSMATVLGAFITIVAIIIAAAFRVAHHAEVLAHRLGEPYGTMILTGAAVLVEVVMLAILMADGHSPTLARDTVYSAVMIDINGIIGLAAIVGGMRHGEQKYNLDASNTYISMLLVSIGVSMFIPDFIPADSWRAYSIFTILIAIVLYAIFLRIQTVEHRYFFQYGSVLPEEEAADPDCTPAAWHIGVLVVSIVLIGLLSEVLSALMPRGLALTGLPVAIPAILIALISASPEILTALRAAARDHMQVVINIALGASLATVLLTVPVIEAIALYRGFRVEMGMTPLQLAMVIVTLLAAMINLHDGESNILEGAVHFAIFATFAMLSFVVA